MLHLVKICSAEQPVYSKTETYKRLSPVCVLLDHTHYEQETT